MQLVFGQDRLVSDFVRSLMPALAGDFGPHAAVGVGHNGVLLGGVVFNEYRPACRSVEMHFAARDPRWLIGPPGDRRMIVRELLAVAFHQLEVQRITGITPKRCRQARAVIDKLGFVREGCVWRGFGDDDAIISGLRRPAWERGPWFKPLASMAEAA